MGLRFLTEDWTLKLFSLGVAVLLFLFVTVENATPVDVDFRIEYRTADDIMLTNDAPTVLHTTLQGPWARFRSFDIADLEPVVLDLSRSEPGTQRHVIDKSAIHSPGGMKIVAIRPSEVELLLDRRVERQMHVRPDIPQAPAFGYEILDVRIVPPRVRVLGPASKMQNDDLISTRTIDVMGREETLTLDVDLRPPPPPLRLLDKRVRVFVEIGVEFVKRSFVNVPVSIVGGQGRGHGVRVNPSAVTLTVKGPRRTVDKMDKDQLDAYVDVAADLADNHKEVEKTVLLRRDLPESTQLVSPVAKVTVELFSTRRAKRR